MGGRPGNCGGVEQLPWPHPLDIRCIPSCDDQRCPQTWPTVSWGRTVPRGNHWSKATASLSMALSNQPKTLLCAHGLGTYLQPHSCAQVWPLDQAVFL